ncbi:MAG: dual specificity protein phosphatase family protein [Labilithrix sp.]|nr:dual specificity protein phosphatase family protein [Labilithrix sp.]MBX3225330.1 dual specificity protein phosphatase family protein [Labilithrix sp.]
MELFVYSRRALEAVQPHEVPHVIVSITSGPEDVARIRSNAHCRGILRLSFPDAEAASDKFPETALFSPEHARKIWDFVLRHRDVERIVVHCDAGISRSAAVAAALARVLKGDDAEFLGGKYRPNMRVYRLLLDAAPS